MSTAYYHPSLNLFGVLSESNRIITAHSRHFLALSVFFLLPFTFSVIFWKQSPNPTKTELLLGLLYSFFCLVLFLPGVSTITYSTFHGFYGRPIKLVSSIKSVLYSFLPLLSTFISSQLVIFLIVMSFTIIFSLIVFGVLVFGFGIDLLSNKNYLMVLGFLIGIVVLVIVTWFQVNWSLWGVIVVVESKWGYESLRRSRYLVTGMRGVALSLMLLYGSAIGFLGWVVSYTSAEKAGQASNGWLSWGFVLKILLSSPFITIFMLYNLAAKVVLYLYCKALHGELALEIAEDKEFELAGGSIDTP